ncbi:MAG: T9SS type A sorting domain-containing protein [Saprospiraceae bacterium]
MTNSIRVPLLMLWVSFMCIPKLLATSSSSANCNAEFTFAFINDSNILFFNTSETYVSHVWTINGNSLYNNENGVLLYTTTTVPFEACLSIQTADGCTDNICLEVFRQSPNAFCAQNECIWPGDTNRDWRANQFDLLNLGLGHGQTGPQREFFPIEDNHIAWAPNTAADWDHWIDNTLNYKHLDCDGDGVVQEIDVEAILQNYKPDFDYSPSPTPGAVPVYLQFTNEVVQWNHSTMPSIELTAKLMVGTEELPVENLHGIALDFSYPYELMEAGAITLAQPQHSFMGYPNELLTVEYDLFNWGLGRYDIAVSRKATTGVSDFGNIFNLNFIVSGDIIGGLNEPVTSFEIAVERVKMVNANGDTITYALGDTARVAIVNSKLANAPIPDTNPVVDLFPNPVNHAFYLHTPNHIMQAMVLFDSQGRRLLQNNIGSNQAEVDVRHLKPGLYWVKVLIGDDWISRKMIVQ